MEKQSSSDRALWQQAQSFNQLCELMAQFIESKVRFSPGYGADDVDSETSVISDRLAAINRAGFMTTCSQPGDLAEDYRQRAFVNGFASSEVALRIAKLTLYTDLYVAIYRPGENYGSLIPVTVEDYEPFSWSGFAGFEEIEFFENSCGHSAVIELSQAYSVSIIDLQWGREDYLWTNLLEVLLEEGPQQPYQWKPYPGLRWEGFEEPE